MDAMDDVEIRHALTQLAAVLRHFYLELLEQGFTEAQALQITIAKSNA